MASIVKRPATRYWHAQFRDSSGRLLERTTRVTNPKVAQKIAEGFEAAAQKQKNLASLRESFNSLLAETFGEEVPVRTARDFAKSWIQNKSLETKPSTLATYRRTIDIFLEFLGPKAEVDLADVTQRQVVEFRNKLAGTLSAETVNLHLQRLRMFFKSAQADGCITANPAQFVPPIKSDPMASVSRQAFSVPQIQSLLSIADPEWQSLIKFGLYTGQRLGDIARLTWANVDLAREELRFVTGKTGRTVTIPLGGPLQAHILDLAHPDELGQPIHPLAFQTVLKEGRVGSLSLQFAQLLGQAGLRQPRENHRGKGKGRDSKRTKYELSFHSLRHTAVSLLKDAGIPQAVVMELVGHRSEAISNQYTHTGRESLAKAVNALPEV